jgi:cell surface protein SprA
MLKQKNHKNRLILLFLTIGLFASSGIFARDYFAPSNFFQQDTLQFPIRDRRTDNITGNNTHGMDLKRPVNIKDSVIYDPKTKQYYIVEKVGTRYYRTPIVLSQAEFLALMAKKQEAEYFQKRAKLLSGLNYGLKRPKLNFTNNLVNRLFGAGPDGIPKIEIKPQGEVNIITGYQGQRIQNPTLPERAQKNGGFDFDMNYRFNMNASIGERLKFPISQNSLANLDWENQLKLDYAGDADAIVKVFQAGNISFPTRTTLIPGANQIFGIKTQLQFGKLFGTFVIADQKSQRSSVALQGGAAAQRFEVKADEYEENRHFLVAQYFRKNYKNALRSMPFINSPVQVRRVEVWVTNRNGTTTETRDIVGLMDLGETDPFRPYPGGLGGIFPRNEANSLYTQVISTNDIRNPAFVSSKLLGLGLQPVQDFEKTFARKLRPDEFYFNSKLGFISLSQPLRDDEVLGVSLEFSVNGRVYKIGEFSQDVPPDSTRGISKVLFVKLLKATSARTNLPIWDLMMKNVYSVGYGQLQRQDFRLDVLYAEPSLGEKNYMPDVDPDKRLPLLTLLNLDRLNNQNDPQSDGQFDYVDSITVIPQYSRIIFPVLEPFGHDLDYVFTGPGAAIKQNKYLYYPLYDTIKAIAQQYPNLNRFIIRGSSKSSGGAEYNIGFNIPRGSVTVTAGGQLLQENIDYTIDYDLGNVRILNTGILNAGLPVNINYENNAAGFSFQQRNYMALRLDYQANKKLSLGSTLVRLGERPFFKKMQYNDEPIRNTMIGADFNYQSQWKQLTRWLDKFVPFYSTTAPSSITASGEAAVMIPGHPPQIGKGGQGRAFLDDFEGARTSYDLKFPFNVWSLSSTPYKATDINGNLILPGADVNNDLAYGRNRAKLAWYQIEQNLQDKRSNNNPMRNIPGFLDSISDVRTRLITQSEVFPNRTTDFGQNLLPTFDLAYYPSERGPYNYDAATGTVNTNGTLKNPKQRWGGIMRSIDQPDFETANFEFLEFWMQDPFIDRASSTGGQLYFNLGNISEDLLRDGRRFFENGLNTPTIPAAIDTTRWGRVPLNPIQVTTAFSNNPNDRSFQDVGFDGMDDKAEDSARRTVINNLQSFLSPAAFSKIQSDPSSDNYKWYRSSDYDNTNAGILTRYKNINNPQGNSPVSSSNSEFSEAYTLYPDGEDLNRDNTLNETEEYFQYKVDLKPNMGIGSNYIVDKRTTSVSLPNGQPKQVSWYLFRIPIREYYRKVGNIPDFKSIRFIRMFMHNFDEPVVARFARLELVRNQWRQFSFDVANDGVYRTPCGGNTVLFSTGAVNIEENDRRTPINYISPCNVVREQLVSNNLNQLENEQSMSLVFKNLPTECSRAVYKTINYDLNQYKQLAMFIHAESAPPPALQIPDKKLQAVIRIGNDYINNYYEIRIPLKITPAGRYTEDVDCGKVWPDVNNLDVNLDFLRSLKIRRNSSGSSLTTVYKEQVGDRFFSIMGNPSLGEVRGIMIAVHNSDIDNAYSGEIWVNELRMIGLSEKGGVAATGRVNINLADWGSLNAAATMHTVGFGTLEQRVNERARDNFLQLDLSANLEMGKALPKKWGMSIPVFASYSRTTSTPQYDQYDKDLPLKDKIKSAPSEQRDSIRNSAIDQTVIKTLSVSNVRKNNTSGKKQRIYSPENFDVSYAVNKTERQNPLVEQDDVIKHYGGVGYSYNSQPKPWEPLKNVKFLKSKWFSLIREFNINPMPSLLGFRADVNRQFGVFRPRSVGTSGYKVPESYNKYFTFDRKYDMRWDITRALNLDFSALNNARIDEPFGRLDNKPKKDTVRRNFLDGGRNTIYNQKVNASYTLPVSKLPLTDWTTFSLKYSAEYNWIGASRLVVNLGNIIENKQTRGVTGEFDFTKLYNKVRFFRRLDEPSGTPGTVNRTRKVRDTTVRVNPADTSGKKKGKRAKKLKVTTTKQLKPIPIILKGFGKLITSLKRVNVNFNEDFGTRLPGYMDSTRYVGNNWKSRAPGLDFIMGYQPDTSWLNKAARKNLITRDPLFNELFTQRFNQTLDITAQLEPFRDFTIDVNLNKTFSKDYNELFKDTVGTGAYRHLGPYASGSFNISYVALKTMFTKFDPNQTSEIFNKFQDYRKILSQRLGKQYPYYTQQGVANPVQTDGYYYGFNRYATDVLIPSFVAAYTGADPENVSLLKQDNRNIRSNPFAGFIPRPNWGVTYRGLTRIKGIEKIFTNVSISHKYNSSLGMNSFNSALFYADTFGLNFPTFYDTVSKNLVPYFLVPNITLSESFEPLLSVDLQFTNRLNVNFDYRKKRDVSLSLIDFQVSELRSTQYGVRVDWTKQAKPGKAKKVKILRWNMQLQNDIRFQLDWSVRDDATSNSRLDQANSFVTGGQKVVRLSPSVDYTLNKRVNLRFFYDRNKVIPNLPSSSPVTTTRAGLEVRVSLAE